MIGIGKETFDRDFVCRIAVADNTARITKVVSMVQNSMRLGRITVRRKVKAKDKAGFAVNDEPDVILFAFDFDNSFISVPFIGVEVHRRNEFDGNVGEERREFLTPVSHSHMRYFDIIQHFEYKAIFRDEFFPIKDIVRAVKIRKMECRIRVKSCLPTNDDIDGGSLTVGFGVKNE
jgi:hypothetical protein